MGRLHTGFAAIIGLALISRAYEWKRHRKHARKARDSPRPRTRRKGNEPVPREIASPSHSLHTPVLSSGKVMHPIHKQRRRILAGVLGLVLLMLFKEMHTGCHAEERCSVSACTGAAD